MLFLTLLLLALKQIVAQIPFDPAPIPNIWEFSQKMDLYVYANNEPLQNRFDDENELIAKIESLTFGEEIRDVKFDHNKFNVDTRDPPLYLHIHLIKAGIHPDPLKSPFDISNSIYRRHPLTKMMKRPVRKTNLLAGQQPEKDAKERDAKVHYWYPEITINLVNHKDPIQFPTFPAYIRRLIYADRIRKAYFPIIYVNEFWELKSRRIPFLNGPTKADLPLRIHFSTTSWFKFLLMAHLSQVSSQDQEAVLGVNRELEGIKRMLLEASPWLIALTVTIVLLHVAFSYLAFKHDVKFWKTKTDLAGLSVRGVLINAVCQLIILGYLLDTEQTNFLVLASVGIGALIELWKVTRVLRVVWRKSSLVPWLWTPRLTDQLSYVKSGTREYDQVAVRYLAAAVIPLLVAYSAWSLKYEAHKSWFSWLIRSLVGFVYTFGFISLTPQLFINYKLKSVAHMPRKAFIYKTLNTIVDDLLAFAVKMPWTRQVACLRDDVLYVVYLYQLWAYPADKTRVNEFSSRSQSQTFASNEDGSVEDVSNEAEGSSNNEKSDKEKTSSVSKRKVRKTH